MDGGATDEGNAATPMGQPSGVHAEYVVCISPSCWCKGDGAAHGPFWRRFWYSEQRLRSRYVHRADAMRVALLCGRDRVWVPLG